MSPSESTRAARCVHDRTSRAIAADASAIFSSAAAPPSRDRVGDAVGEVLVEQLERDGLERLASPRRSGSGRRCSRRRRRPCAARRAPAPRSGATAAAPRPSCRCIRACLEPYPCRVSSARAEGPDYAPAHGGNADSSRRSRAVGARGGARAGARDHRHGARRQSLATFSAARKRRTRCTSPTRPPATRSTLENAADATVGDGHGRRPRQPAFRDVAAGDGYTVVDGDQVSAPLHVMAPHRYPVAVALRRRNISSTGSNTSRRATAPSSAPR